MGDAAFEEKASTEHLRQREDLKWLANHGSLAEKREGEPLFIRVADTLCHQAIEESGKDLAGPLVSGSKTLTSASGPQEVRRCDTTQQGCFPFLRGVCKERSKKTQMNGSPHPKTPSAGVLAIENISSDVAMRMSGEGRINTTSSISTRSVSKSNEVRQVDFAFTRTSRDHHDKAVGDFTSITFELEDLSDAEESNEIFKNTLSLPNSQEADFKFQVLRPFTSATKGNPLSVTPPSLGRHLAPLGKQVTFDGGTLTDLSHNPESWMSLLPTPLQRLPLNHLYIPALTCGVRGVVSVVWCPWCGVRGVVSVVWCRGVVSVVWCPWCGIRGVVSVVWCPWCGVCGVVSVVWCPWCGVRGVVSVVWCPWCGVRGVVSVVWCPWCGVRGVVSVVWYPWCGVRGVVSVVCLAPSTGSHDSFSYSLNPEGAVAPDAPPAVRGLVGAVPCLARPALLRWSVTQRATVTQQLRHGVRYFDIRVAAEGSKFYFVHGLFGADLQPLLSEVRLFLAQHPGEVVLLDFQHFHGLDKEEHAALIALVRSTFATTLCPVFAHPETLNLHLLAQLKYQVLVFYRDAAGREAGPWLWSGEALPNPWPAAVTVSAMLDFLHTRLAARDSNTFFVTQ
ncbi:PI-PLC X domain-containing protein 3 [Chionoecetes opilio]|uniref:PI-PLC X domain-containing protein 3 n=1 Tax=Chionoecetes opilio TaxID=41210 RepID=A0A8J4XXP0_CHIOP|nr:PI-PLC X domain-containing protein 3 [Chionoecetes opilio]